MDEIRKIPDPILRARCATVKKVGAGLERLLETMALAMESAGGIGIAAPQVGVAKRVIIVKTEDGLIELVNPRIVRSAGTAKGIEGCLSVPGLMGEVERAQEVTVTGLDRHGRQVWVDGRDLLARVLQHEIDHLDGVLFVDKAAKVIKPEDLEASAEPDSD